MNSLTKLRREVDHRIGKRDLIAEQLDRSEKNFLDYKLQQEEAEEARTIIQHVAQKTQEQLEYHVSEIVSLALSAVFPDPYELALEFSLRRGKTEADIKFVRDEETLNPLDSSGGGPVDVAAFALRIALWSLRRPRSRNTIVLDEPFRFLSRDLQPKASMMLKELSRKLNLQFIIVSHNEEIIEEADRVFQIRMRKGRSYVDGQEEKDEGARQPRRSRRAIKNPRKRTKRVSQ